MSLETVPDLPITTSEKNIKENGVIREGVGGDKPGLEKGSGIFNNI